MAYTPIQLAYCGALPHEIYREPEGATQTILAGVPVKLSGGYLVACDTANPWTAADVVYGITAEPAHNLAVAGTAQAGYSLGSPTYQSAAKIIPVGVGPVDGKLGVYRANGTNIFRASLKSPQTFSQALVAAGVYYALVYDSTSKLWYIDSTDVAGNNNVVEIIAGDNTDSTLVTFRFKAGQRYFD